MGFHYVFMDETWAYDLGFYWSWSEAQKGAKDMGTIKALIVPVRSPLGAKRDALFSIS